MDLKKDLVIDCFCLFGGIDICLPKDVKLEINGVPFFGGIENKYYGNKDSNITIYINHTTILEELIYCDVYGSSRCNW